MTTTAASAPASAIAAVMETVCAVDSQPEPASRILFWGQVARTLRTISTRSSGDMKQYSPLEPCTRKPARGDSLYLDTFASSLSQAGLSSLLKGVVRGG